MSGILKTGQIGVWVGLLNTIGFLEESERTPGVKGG